MLLQIFLKSGQQQERCLCFILHSKFRAENYCAAKENNTELLLSFGRHFPSEEEDFVYLVPCLFVKSAKHQLNFISYNNNIF